MRSVIPLTRPIIALACLLAGPVRADDWPQWMGPDRDNVWRATGLIERFPEGGPNVVWRQPIAGGYASPAVAGDRVFVTDYVVRDAVTDDSLSRDAFTGIERVWCLDRATGKPIWKHQYPVNYDIDYPAGPRCSPTIDGDKVYTVGAEGDLHCFAVETGEVLWSKNYSRDYGAETPLWGYAGHPLIDGDKLICIVGGEGSHAVAFDKTTGDEIWRSLTSTKQGYSPPTLIESAGVRQLILLHPDALVSVDPDSGKPFWSVEYGADYGSIIMSPVFAGNRIYAGGFSNKNLLVELDPDRPAAKTLWRDQNRAAISAVNVQPFFEDGILYGFDQSGMMHAVEFETGRRLWDTTDPIDGGRPGKSATAFIVKQADRFWMFNERGELLIARLSPDGYQEIDRAAVIEPTNSAYGRPVVWSAPAWAGRQVFLRNDREIVCIDLAAPVLSESTGG